MLNKRINADMSISNSFTNKVSLFINRYELMDKKKLYLVALSGGADSVALLMSLKSLGYNIEAIHCNFHLRGEESNRDESFCKALCEKNNIKLHIAHFDTTEYADLHRVSIEMAARDLRYKYFEQLRNDLLADGVCIGHHIEDSVETFLLNIIRGTGIKGLTGISQKNGYILRPLLDTTKTEIIQYLKYIKQEYVTDSTNLISDVKRNKIRLEIIPLLKEMNPSVENSIANTIFRINEAYKVFEKAIEDSAMESISTKNNRTYIDLSTLLSQASPEYTLFHILRHFSFSSATIDDIYNNIKEIRNGSVFYSPTHSLILDRGFLIAEETNGREKFKGMKIPESGVYVIDDNTRLKISIESITKGFSPSKSNETITIDAGKVKFPLTVRPYRNGDKFIPFGMKGRKLISDYLTDKKLSNFEKKEQLVLTDKSDNILWLIGQRTDNRFKITDQTTKSLRISFIKSPNT